MLKNKTRYITMKIPPFFLITLIILSIPLNANSYEYNADNYKKTDWKVNDIGYMCVEGKSLTDKTVFSPCSVKILEIDGTTFKVESLQKTYGCRYGEIISIENGADKVLKFWKCF